jgi:hypothetical protein
VVARRAREPPGRGRRDRRDRARHRGRAPPTLPPARAARRPATCAAAVGRPITLGVGCSNQFVVEMHGPPTTARPRTRANTSRCSTRCARARRAGSPIAAPCSASTRCTRRQAPRSASVLLGALGPADAARGRRAPDGTIATWCNERAIERAIRPALEQAAKDAGRAAPRVAARRVVAVTDDAPAARARRGEVRDLRLASALPAYGRARRARERRRGASPAARAMCATGCAPMRTPVLTDLLAAPLQLGDHRAARGGAPPRRSPSGAGPAPTATAPPRCRT